MLHSAALCRACLHGLFFLSSIWIFPCNIKLVLRNSYLSLTSGFLMYYIVFQMSVLLEDNTHWIRVPEDSPDLEKIGTERSQRWTPPHPIVPQPLPRTSLDTFSASLHEWKAGPLMQWFRYSCRWRHVRSQAC